MYIYIYFATIFIYQGETTKTVSYEGRAFTCSNVVYLLFPRET